MRLRESSRPDWSKPAAMARRASALSFSIVLASPGVVPVAAEMPAALAEVNGQTITADDVDRALGARLRQLEEQIYNLKRRELDSHIAGLLVSQEATKRGVSVAALMDAEVTGKVALITEQEIDAYYQANKTRLRGPETAVRERIRAQLQQQRLTARYEEFLQSLRSQAKVVVHLQPPPVVRVDVSIDGAPVRGAPEAPVTLVEFSDFHCPFCKNAQATLKQILDRYTGKVRLVYRDFPLDSLHPQARAAAEAARCANDQARFWSYHDALFASAPVASPESLRRSAEELGLDIPTFERCVASRAHSEAVQRDIDEGQRLGLTGTPAFFINGRPLVGAQPLEAFVRIIEEELARTDQARTEKK